VSNIAVTGTPVYERDSGYWIWRVYEVQGRYEVWRAGLRGERFVKSYKTLIFAKWRCWRAL